MSRAALPATVAAVLTLPLGIAVQPVVLPHSSFQRRRELLSRFDARRILGLCLGQRELDLPVEVQKPVEERNQGVAPSEEPSAHRGPGGAPGLAVDENVLDRPDLGALSVDHRRGTQIFDMVQLKSQGISRIGRRHLP